MDNRKLIRPYLLNLMSAMCERPKMYASTAASLEEQLSLMNEILRFVESDESSHTSYADFLREAGYGSANVCERIRLSQDDMSQEDLYDIVVQVWRRFRQQRLSQGSSPAES